jgi:hypothetical protein
MIATKLVVNGAQKLVESFSIYSKNILEEIVSG